MERRVAKLRVEARARCAQALHPAFRDQLTPVTSAHHFAEPLSLEPGITMLTEEGLFWRTVDRRGRPSSSFHGLGAIPEMLLVGRLAGSQHALALVSQVAVDSILTQEPVQARILRLTPGPANEWLAENLVQELRARLVPGVWRDAVMLTRDPGNPRDWEHCLFKLAIPAGSDLERDLKFCWDNLRFRAGQLREEDSKAFQKEFRRRYG